VSPALSVLNAAIADESDPPPPRFQPWQEIWQCNDIRVTVTARDPFSIEYDLGGTIWGGSRFTRIRGGGPSPMTTELQDLFAIAAENAATVFRKTGSFAPMWHANEMRKG